MKFTDRAAAGRQLAAKLTQFKNGAPVVLSLPRGGVAVGFEIAQTLGAPLSAGDRPSIHVSPSLRVSDQNSLRYRAELSLSPPVGASQHAHTPLSGVWTPIVPKLIACMTHTRTWRRAPR